MSVDDRLVIEPGRRKVRVRGLHSHGHALTEAPPGRRLAVSLSGVAHHEIQRGLALVRDGQWHLSARLDASLQVLAGLGRAVGREGAFIGHFGSGEYPVRLSVLCGKSQIRRERPVSCGCASRPPYPSCRATGTCSRGQAGAETVGGGEVLDVARCWPPPERRRRVPQRAVVEERGFVDADELERLTGERRAPDVSHWVVDAAALATAEEELRQAVRTAGKAGVDLAVLTDRQRALVALLDDLVVVGSRLCSADVVRSGPRPEEHPYLAALTASPFNPPPPDGVDRTELRVLEHQGLAADCDGVWFAASALERVANTVAQLLAAKRDGVTVAAVREALGTTRHYVLPLLAYLDVTGVTRRRGDLRIGGPRLPTVETPPG